MTTTPTLHPTHVGHAKPVIIALAGAAFATVTGLGVAAVVLDDWPGSTQPAVTVPATAGGYVGDGTDHEIHGLMHRLSLPAPQGGFGVGTDREFHELMHRR